MKKLSLSEQSAIFGLLATRGNELEVYLAQGHSELEERYREESKIINSARKKIFSTRLFEYMEKEKFKRKD